MCHDRGMTYDTFRARGYMPALDGLRAIAVLAVVTWHIPGDPLGRLNGYRGVWVFFAISGYLITTLALREEEQRGALSVKGFVVRRSHRILPLYYLVLAVTVMWVFVFHQQASQPFGHDFVAYLLYVQEFPIFHAHFNLPLGQAWSLGIEELFYALWPVIGFIWLARSRWRPSVTVVLLAGCLAMMVADRPLAQFWGSLADILAGCLLAMALHDRAIFDRLAVLGRPAMAWCAVGVLAACEPFAVAGSQPLERCYTAVALLVVAAVIVSDAGPARLLAWRPLVYVGRLSYGIYLLHSMGLALADKMVPDGGKVSQLVVFVVGMGLTLPVCAVLHRWVERPLIARGRLVAARYTSAPVAVAIA